jgi:hypothetical protein
MKTGLREQTVIERTNDWFSLFPPVPILWSSFVTCEYSICLPQPENISSPQTHDFTTKSMSGLTMAMRQCVFLMIAFILLILTAGCIDTSTEGPPLPTMSTLPVPGTSPQVLQIIGDVTGQGIPGGTIDTITFTVGLIDSHTSVDMEQLTIVYADAIRTETLYPVEGFHGDPPKGFWSITRVENEIGDPNNRLDNEEQFVITINPKAPLVPRQVITIDVKTANGSSLTIRRVAPSTILENNILLPP